MGRPYEPDHRAAVRMRTSLAYSRRVLGVDFDEAWTYGLEDATRALCTTERKDWRLAFENTRASWQAAYDGTSDPLGLRELVA